MFYNNFNMNGCCNNENKCCPTVCEEKCCEDPVYEAPVEKCIKKDFQFQFSKLKIFFITILE